MSLLRALWKGWKRLAHRMGVFNTKLLLFLVYYLVLGPTALVYRLFHRDPLAKRILEGSQYVSPEGGPINMERAKQQF